MNESEDFEDLLKKITPYIHLEEARVARREEVEKKEKKNPWRREDGNKREEQRDVRVKIPSLPSRERYDNQLRAYLPLMPNFLKHTPQVHGSR